MIIEGMNKLEIWDRIYLGETQNALAKEYGVSRQRINFIVSKDRIYWEARVGLKGRPRVGQIEEYMSRGTK